MTRGALVLTVAVAGAFVAAICQAEPAPPTYPRDAPRDAPRGVDAALLEKRVAALEAQNAELRRFILINGDNLTVKVPQQLTIEAAQDFTAKAGRNMSLRSSAVLDVRAATVSINGGTRRVARLSDAVGNGVITQGSGTVLVD
jgi:hypothetical protein